MKRFRKQLTALSLALFFTQGHAMTTRGTQILNEQGEPVKLKGINYFGFNNSASMVDGLWAGPDCLSMDFATVVYRMQLLGYNAVRLPFSFNDLFNLSPRNYTQNSPTATASQIQTSVTDPSVTIPPGAKIPPQKFSPLSVLGVANSYLPNDTTLNRFLWVVNFFAKNGFYVLIDNHREDPTVLQNPSQWVQNWVRLVGAICQDPISKEMLMIDILNEPDSFGIRWEGSGNRFGLKDLYIAAMDALYPINPKLLFFIEGTGQGGIGANWGDGFVTDPNLITQFGLSDPNPFFKQLLTKPYLNQVVISPHVYPPTVTYASSNYSGPGLWNRLTSSFGYLTQQGYCLDGFCKIFPVAIGEFGSTFVDMRDLQSMPDIASYLNNIGSAADGKHTTIDNWFYWDWNANSGDTGGIVDNNWRDILWKKVRYLTTIGLTPWYLGSIPPQEMGSLCISIQPISGVSSSYLKPITVGSYSFNIPNFNQAVCQSIPAESYSIVAPPLTVGDVQYTAEPQTVQVSPSKESSAQIVYKGAPIAIRNFIVEVEMGTAWQSSNVYFNTVNLYVKNMGNTAIYIPWNLTLSNSNYQAVSSAWNMDIQSVNNGVISAIVNTGTWETLLPNGANSINVGLIISSSSNNFTPATITVNGQPCTVKTK